jgi:hypothetical protein
LKIPGTTTEIEGDFEIPLSCCKHKKSFPEFDPVDVQCMIFPNVTNANIEKVRQLYLCS